MEAEEMEMTQQEAVDDVPDNAVQEVTSGEIDEELVGAFRYSCKFGTKDEVEGFLSKINPNIEFYNSRPIHWAAESGNVQAVKALLNDPRTTVEEVNNYKRTALHFAAKQGNHEVLRLLLEDSRGRNIDINAVDKQGRTALHSAAEMPGEGDDTEERFLRCLVLLMEKPELQINKPDFHGRSPICRALRKGYEKRVLIMLKYRGVHILNLDYCTVDAGKNARETIQELYPQLQTFMPEPLIEDIKSPKPEIRLLAALQYGFLDEFTEILRHNRDVIEMKFGEPYHCTCLELACLIKGREDFVRVLLEAGCDPNVKNYVCKIPLLHVVAEKLNLPVLEILVGTENIEVKIDGLNGGTVLHWLALNNFTEGGGCVALEKCISLLLKSERGQIDVDGKDSRGDTPLHIAVRWKNLNMAVILLASGASVNTWNHRNYTPLHVATLSGDRNVVLTLLKYGADINGQRDRGTPLHVAAKFGNKDISLLLLKERANFMTEAQGEPSLKFIDPETLETFFDHCIQSNDKSPKSRDYMLIFKYGFMIPHNRDSLSSSSDIVMLPLLKISEMQELRHLLKHPVILSVLYMKWRQASIAVYVHIAIYTMFLILLTLNVLFVNKLGKSQRNESKGTCHYFESTLNILLCVFVLPIVIREVVQIRMDRNEYFSNGRNIVDALIIISTLVICFDCDTEIDITRHAAAIAVLLSWIEFLLLIGRLPSISVRLEMLKKVCKSFFKFGLCYFPLIFSFALSFSVLFEGQHNPKQNTDVVSDDRYILNKILTCSNFVFQTVVMFTGEFDAKELPFSETPITSHVVFFMFVFLVALALLGLLNGLAVSDTQAIIDDAEILSTIARAKLVLQMEGIVLRCKKWLYGKDYMKKVYFSFGDLPNRRLYVYPNQKYQVKVQPRGKVVREMDAEIVDKAIAIAIRNAMKS
ncbi:transient receptor potential channel pyrexia-like [Periplaneta americana]|uniref:transient receptor potential channel pyrexia-like n=1 Tax=Periplaneta americana TaxID=6978 RepID=UPI0037E7A81E